MNSVVQALPSVSRADTRVGSVSCMPSISHVGAPGWASLEAIPSVLCPWASHQPVLAGWNAGFRTGPVILSWRLRDPRAGLPGHSERSCLMFKIGYRRSLPRFLLPWMLLCAGRRSAVAAAWARSHTGWRTDRQALRPPEVQAFEPMHFLFV